MFVVLRVAPQPLGLYCRPIGENSAAQYSKSPPGTMEVLNHLRSSFRSRSASSVASGGSNNSIDTVSSTTSSSDGNDRSSMRKKRSTHVCDLCGKRLIKLAGWRNYFTLPCKCRHVFCKQCITDRLQCRQKVLRSATFELMWTFPCPSNAECGQQLTVDFSRGSSFSKNLVARDLESTDDSWEQDDEYVDDDDVPDEVELGVSGQDDSHLREIG